MQTSACGNQLNRSGVTAGHSTLRNRPKASDLAADMAQEVNIKLLEFEPGSNEQLPSQGFVKVLAQIFVEGNLIGEPISAREILDIQTTDPNVIVTIFPDSGDKNE